MPKVDRLLKTQKEGGCLVITDNGSDFVQETIEGFQSRGYKNIVILGFPEDLIIPAENLSDELPRYSLSGHSIEKVEEIIEKIGKKHGTINDFIYLHPQFTAVENEILFSAKERELIKLVFFMAKFLKTSLTAGAENSFMTVTQLDGNLGCGQIYQYGAFAGGLFGLVKTLNIEWAKVFCRSLDIDPKYSGKKKSETILEEFFDYDSTIVEIGHKDNKRFTLKGVQMNESSANRVIKNPITKDSIFVVSGGGKGVTAACTIKLAEKYKCKFILFGRSDISVSEPQWAKGVSDEMILKKHFMEDFLAKGDKPTPMKIQRALNNLLGSREIKNTIDLIINTGAYAEYVSVDITDKVKVSEALSPIIKKLGNVSGIIHGAGVLADKLIEKKSERDFESVVQPKVDGLASLLNCISIANLDTVVLFSSSAGFYGNEAQADYALANEVLNKTARLIQLINPDCHCIAYNWGPWDGGMVNDQLKKMFNERNIEIIPLEEGASMLGNDLHSDEEKVPQIIVGGSMVVPIVLDEKTLKTVNIRRNLNLLENVFIMDHKINHDAVLPIVSALSWMVESCLKLYPGYSCAEARGIRVFNGIVLSDSQPSEYNIEIKEIQKSNQEGHVLLDVRISSEKEDKKIRFHYSSTVHLRKKGLESSSLDRDLLTFPKENSEPNPYLDNTLFHTGIFREIIETGNFNETNLVLKCKASEVSTKDLGQFQNRCFNAIADDTLLQAMLVWVRRFYQAGSLPLLINKAEFFKPIPPKEEFFIVMEVVESNPNKMIGNITSCDINGSVFTKFSGAEVTISKTLNGKF